MDSYLSNKLLLNGSLALFFLVAWPVLAKDPLCIEISNSRDGVMSVRQEDHCTIAHCSREGQFGKQAFIDGCLQALESGSYCH